MDPASFHEHIELIHIIGECIHEFPRGIPVVFETMLTDRQQNGFLIHEDGKLYIEYYCEPESWKPVRMEADATGAILVSTGVSTHVFHKGSWRFSLIVKLSTTHKRLHELYTARAPRHDD